MQTTLLPRLEQLSMTVLVQLGQEETRKFLRQQPSDGSYMREVFRRAMQYNNQEAWEAIYSSYQGLVYDWTVSLLPASHGVLTRDDVPALINAVFTKFAQGIVK